MKPTEPGVQALNDAEIARRALKLLAERGKPNPTAGACEQRPADLALQRGHQSAHPWLRQAQSFRGPAEVQLLGENQEDLDLGGVHARSPNSPFDDTHCRRGSCSPLARRDPLLRDTV